MQRYASAQDDGNETLRAALTTPRPSELFATLRYQE